MAREEVNRRWRLVLGRYAEEALPGCLGCGGGGQGQDQRLDRVLEYLYGREYAGRGGREGGERQGGSGPSTFSIPEWLGQVRELFPHDTVELIERHALQRYGMTGLVTDPEALSRLEPSFDLLKTVLGLRHLMAGPVLTVARQLIRRVVEELTKRLACQVRPVLWGRLSRRPTRLRSIRNLDWIRTVRDNLKHYDQERRQIVLHRLHFLSRVHRHLPWRIIIAVDTSASMAGSVIYSAIMAGIFHGLPAVQVHLITFDTALVDLTEHVADPVEVLLSVQLGGGTDIGRALRYCEQLVESPTRTMVILVTDFFEGANPQAMLGCIARLHEAGVRVLGLAALEDDKGTPAYDKDMAGRCVEAGAEVAALSPRRLAEWVARVLS